MSVYINQPSAGYAPPTLLPGDTLYLLGSLNTKVPPTRMSVQTVAIATNVVTLGVTIIEGLIPVAGALISVYATTTDSGAANVNNIAIVSVTINATTGVGTLTYDATGSNQTTTADVGYAIVPQPEVGETATVSESSLCFALQIPPFGGSAPRLTYEVSFSGAPGTFELDVQEADIDLNANYVLTAEAAGKITAVDSSQVARADLTSTIGKFQRINVVALANHASVTMIAKVRRVS
jgi:hypothetical protein